MVTDTYRQLTVSGFYFGGGACSCCWLAAGVALLRDWVQGLHERGTWLYFRVVVWMGVQARLYGLGHGLLSNRVVLRDILRDLVSLLAYTWAWRGSGR